MDDVAAFAPPLPAVLGPNVSAGLRASLDLKGSVLILLDDFKENVFGNFSDSLRLLTNLTKHLVCVVCACVRACMCACVHACMCACVIQPFLPPRRTT